MVYNSYYKGIRNMLRPSQLLIFIIFLLIYLNGSSHCATSAPPIGSAPIRNTLAKPPEVARPPAISNFGIGTLNSNAQPINTDECGRPWLPGTVDLSNLYLGNRTADFYRSKGYAITILKMNQDSIQEFQYSKDGKTSLFTHQQTPSPTVSGRLSTSYMALFSNQEIHLCNGVLINPKWILTAAHCALGITPTTVALGQYEIGSLNNPIQYPLELSIGRIVVHPQFRKPSMNHDLALVKLKEDIPKLRLQHDISPICLPWDEQDLYLVGRRLFMTGWSTDPAGMLYNPLLSVVTAQVFEPAYCDSNYRQFQQYKELYPNGITHKHVICAGDVIGNCYAEAVGAPLTYENMKAKITLAGILSIGNCQGAQYPELYVPINNPSYLSWIKQVAFDGN